MRPFRFLPPLAHVALIAGFGLAVDWTPRPSSAFVLAPSASEGTAPPAMGDEATALSDPQDYGDRLEQIAGRPLFVQGRGMAMALPAAQPAALASSAPAARREAPLRIFVRGTFVEPGGGRALVELPGEENGIWVRPGEVIEGWTVEDILPRGMRVSRGEEDLTIPLFE